MPTTNIQSRLRTKVKAGHDVQWYWVVTLVLLTFLFVYLLNNVKPFVEPFKAFGYENELPIIEEEEIIEEF